MENLKETNNDSKECKEFVFNEEEFHRKIEELRSFEIYPNDIYRFLRIKSIKKPQVVLILGGPGSGKSTQSKFLCQEFKMHHISIGEVLRSMRGKKNNLNKEIEYWMNVFDTTGRLMPLELTFHILLQCFYDLGWNDKPFVVDGFIKDFSVLKKWDSIMTPILDTKLAIYYKIEISEMKRRVYNRSNIEKRGDDKVIENRIQCFINRTLPAIKLIEDKGILVTIDGNQNIDVIREESNKAYLNAICDINKI